MNKLTQIKSTKLVANLNGTDDVLREFRKLNFIVGSIPIAKLSNDNTTVYQISCLPKYSYNQQVKLAIKSLEELGFSSSQIHIEAEAGATNKRRFIKGISSIAEIQYDLDLGLLKVKLSD